MAANLNKVFLMGNLTRDPELRYTPNGAAVASFSIAVNRSYTDAQGQKKEEVCFVRVVAWGKQAENSSQFLSKGSSVFVEGRLQSRNWETSDGQKRNTIEVVASNIQFLRTAKTAVRQETGAGIKQTDEVVAEEGDTIDIGLDEVGNSNDSVQ